MPFVVVGLFFGFAALSSPAEAGFFDTLFGGGDSDSLRRTMIAPPHFHSPHERLDHSAATPRNGGHRRLGRVKTQVSYLPIRTRRRPDMPARAIASSNGLVDDVKRVNVELCYANGPRSDEIDQSDAILHDPTLRHGDSMMTAQGVRIFHGQSACPHKSSEFLSLAETRNLSATKRGALAAIEQAMRASHGRDLTSAAARIDKPVAQQP